MEREKPGIIEGVADFAKKMGLLATVAIAYLGPLGLAVSVGFLSAAIHVAQESLKRQRLKTA